VQLFGPALVRRAGKTAARRREPGASRMVVARSQGELAIPTPTSDVDLPEAIVRSATDHAIISFDEWNRVLTWSAGAEALLGWCADEIHGQRGAVIFTPEDGQNNARSRNWRSRAAGVGSRMSAGICARMARGNQGVRADADQRISLRGRQWP
jgi:hypothetical protein